MALFGKKSDEEKALASARADLTAAQKKRATLAAREDAAATSADKYSLWRNECDAIDIDIARLTEAGRFAGGCCSRKPHKRQRTPSCGRSKPAAPVQMAIDASVEN